MKQAESGYLVAPSDVFFEFREVDQTRSEGKMMTPDGESEKGYGTAWRTAEENSWTKNSK